MPTPTFCHTILSSEKIIKNLNDLT